MLSTSGNGISELQDGCVLPVSHVLYVNGTDLDVKVCYIDRILVGEKW